MTKNISLFFTSDNHFFHEGIIKFCKRPFATVEEMRLSLRTERSSIWAISHSVVGGSGCQPTMLFPTQYDVGVDNNGFRPVSFNELRTIIQKQQGL